MKLWIMEELFFLPPVDDVMRFLLVSLNDKDLAPAASTSLESVCMSCRDFMGLPHVEVLFIALKSLDGNPIIPRQAAVGVLVSIAVVSCRLQFEESRKIMGELFRYHVGYLNGCCVVSLSKPVLPIPVHSQSCSFKTCPSMSCLFL
jgi:hypothetical protein